MSLSFKVSRCVGKPLHQTRAAASAQRNELDLRKPAASSLKPFDQILGSFKDAYKPESRWSESARRILRGILRECTYLPDPEARSYLSAYAIERFRQNGIKALQSRRKVGADDRFWRKHQLGERCIRELRKANDGDRPKLHKVLSYVYGRSGARRRNYLRPMLRGAGSNAMDQNADETTMLEKRSGTSETMEEDDLDNDWSEDARTSEIDVGEDGEKDALGVISEKKSMSGKSKGATSKGDSDRQRKINRKRGRDMLTPQLHALVVSQIRARPIVEGRTALTDDAPNIPEFNTWGRPMPQSRVRNMSRKWFIEVTERVMPPLPLSQWLRLRNLALGKFEFPVRIPRRKGPEPPKQSMLELVVSGRDVNLRSIRATRKAAITPRLMQRLWRTVFVQCPVMIWDNETMKWNTIWGQEALRSWKVKDEVQRLQTSLEAEEGQALRERAAAAAQTSHETLDADPKLRTTDSPVPRKLSRLEGQLERMENSLYTVG